MKRMPLIAAITGNPEVRMEWKHYFTEIVEHYRVRLVGWPEVEFNPVNLGIGQLENIISAMERDNVTCKWVCYSEEDVELEREKHNERFTENPPKPRKSRLDKGKRRRVATLSDDQHSS
jgi:hypothetical protein